MMAGLLDDRILTQITTLVRKRFALTALFIVAELTAVVLLE